jgi:cytochrome c oxidase cbb3-type subunit 3
MKNHKYPLVFLWLCLLPALVSAQAATAAAEVPTDGAKQLDNIFYWLILTTCAVIFIVAMIFIIRTNQFLYNRVIALEAAKSGALLPSEELPALKTGDSFWTRMRKQYWEDPVPVEREGEIMFHHAYDGIRELDNRLPPWWVNMFLITIVWALGYMWYYHWGGDGPSSGEEYKSEVEIAKKEIAVALAGQANAVDESNVKALTDATALGEGELIYKSVCAACHGQKGEGGVGPNMTDEQWLHGGGIKNVFKTVKYGVPEKGMIAWASQLKPADMQKVSSYILTLKGTNPPNAKAPQGEVWVEEDAAAPADTTKQVVSDK